MASLADLPDDFLRFPDVAGMASLEVCLTAVRSTVEHMLARPQPAHPAIQSTDVQQALAWLRKCDLTRRVKVIQLWHQEWEFLENMPPFPTVTDICITASNAKSDSVALRRLPIVFPNARSLVLLRRTITTPAAFRTLNWPMLRAFSACAFVRGAQSAVEALPQLRTLSLPNTSWGIISSPQGLHGTGRLCHLMALYLWGDYLWRLGPGVPLGPARPHFGQIEVVWA